MVRKRSRASRKYHSSDDNDTDSDYALADSPVEPAPKKYSLRQRKKTVFIEDFDYEDAEDDAPANESDDEDFEFEKEVALNEASKTTLTHAVSVDPLVSHSREEGDNDESNELIDFEDMIRADIVVNKSRIDYDNLISKSEIKVDQSELSVGGLTPNKSRRGRKPKQQVQNVLEPQTEVKEDFYEQNDLLLEVPLACVQTELHEGNENGLDHSKDMVNLKQQQPDSTIRESSDNNETSSPQEERNIIQETPSQESVIKVNPLLANGSNSYHIETPEVHFDLKQESDDDDVVLIESKHEVIVLDD